MSRSPKSTTTPAPVFLAGLTAVQIREMLAQKTVTAFAVIEFLRAKEAAHGLRYPARKLLEELTGAKPAAQKPEAKPAAAKAGEKPAAKPAKAGEKPAAPTPEPAKDDLTALVAAVAQLAERIAALEGAKPAAKPVAPKPEPVKAKPAKAEPAEKPAKAKPEPVEDDAITEAEARVEFEGLKLAQLRDIADFDTDGMSKSEIIEEMIAQAIEEGVIVAAVPAKAAKAGKPAKPDLKVVAREVAEVEF